jgi:hypothetical protein
LRKTTAVAGVQPGDVSVTEEELAVMSSEGDPSNEADRKTGAPPHEFAASKPQDDSDRNQKFASAVLRTAAYQAVVLVLASSIPDEGATLVLVVAVAVLSWLPVVAIGIRQSIKPRTLTTFDLRWARYAFLWMVLGALQAELWSRSIMSRYSAADDRGGGGQVHAFGQRFFENGTRAGRKMDQSPAAP